MEYGELGPTCVFFFWMKQHNLNVLNDSWKLDGLYIYICSYNLPASNFVWNCDPVPTVKECSSAVACFSRISGDTRLSFGCCLRLIEDDHIFLRKSNSYPVVQANFRAVVNDSVQHRLQATAERPRPAKWMPQIWTAVPVAEVNKRTSPFKLSSADEEEWTEARKNKEWKERRWSLWWFTNNLPSGYLT